MSSSEKTTFEKEFTSTLLIFARAPVRGQLKPLLAQTIGDERTLEICRASLDDVCALTRGTAERRVLQIAGALDDPFLIKLAQRDGLEIAPQRGQNLGERMHLAMADALKRSLSVCIITSDCPTVPPHYVHRAFTALGEQRFVIGPTTDYRFWLIGGSAPIARVVQSVAWGTDEVLQRMLQNLQEDWATLLPFHYHIDDASDLELMRAHLQISPPEIAPAMRRVLGLDEG